MDPTGNLVKNRSVVIVDDDDVTRHLLRSVLRAAGLNVVGDANDGARALAAYQKLKPEIMCLDIEMPGMTGLEVLAKIREDDADTIVLMITGAATGENVRGAIAARANGIIVKPFNTAKILTEMERAIARKLAVEK